jgi:hypothetical protein
MTLGARPGRRLALPGFAFGACVALAGCAADAVSPEHPKVIRGQPITPYAFAEDCVHLAAGDRLLYEFMASAPVSFNIHYHDSNAVVAPIVRDGVSGDSGVFLVRLTQDYCLMWEAGPAGAVLDYRITLRPVER